MDQRNLDVVGLIRTNVFVVNAAAVAALSVACGEPAAGDPFAGGASMTLTGAEGVESGSGAASDDSADGEIKLDVASDTSATSGDNGSAEGCEKVDFLFVIDNSSSMGDDQDSLIASFPGFIQSIQQTLTDAQDYHLMVVDTDAMWGATPCEVFCPTTGVCPAIPDYPCGQPVAACDRTLGAGVVYPMAADAPNRPCEFSTGARYMDSSEPDLASAFQCSAKVGSTGSNDERPMGAMVAGLSEDLAMPGACNEGFIREDAILVITVITDEDDDDSSGVPPGWFANVVASKRGDARAVVMLGLVNDYDVPEPVCPPGGQDPVRVREFIDMFPNRIRASVCEPTYDVFFQQAVDLIATTCREFVPPEA